MTITRRLGFVATTALLVGAAALVGLWSAGWRAYVIHTGSMTPTYQPGDVVLDRPAAGDYRAGDTVTFRIGPDERVTHRVTRVVEGGVRTKGDGNEKADEWTIPHAHVDGVVEHHVPRLGYLLVFLQQPAGVGGVMSSAVALVLLWGLCFPGGAPARPLPKNRLTVVPALAQTPQ